MIGVGVVGLGYWGPNLLRNFAEEPGCRLRGVCDLRSERLAPIPARYPGVAVTTDLADLLEDPTVDAVAIATPISTHFDLALAALQAGKHVLVEKPLAATVEGAERLVREADRRGLVLMVDHTFVYTGAVRKIRELLERGELGEVYYYDSVRVNLGLFQHDVDVLWDLAVHDLAILDHLLPCSPVAVSATGINHVAGEPANLAYLTLFFEGSLIAHIHANWLAPVKIRRTLIGASQKMVVYDDLEPSEKVKLYDRGITLASGSESVYRMLVGYRTGDMWAPHLEMTEALRTEVAHFRQCVETGTCPVTDGPSGVRVVRILEAASRSMAERGRPIDLTAPLVSA